MKFIRQGEVGLVKIGRLPNGLKEKNKVLAYGETTGHTHRFESKQALVFADKSGNQFVKLTSPSKLIHEEHKELEIPKGVYKVVLQREQDILENTRQVMD